MKVIDKVSVFLLMGQSNMAGRGRLSDVAELQHPKVHMFRRGQWLPAREPLHTDKPDIAGIGMGMSFAVELVKRSCRNGIGLVPCAAGGTPLNRWMPGADLYDDAVAKARAALTGGELTGILWHQGEGDSGSRSNAASYGERFGNLIQNLRSDLSAESAPVIAGELGSFLQHHGECKFFEVVNRQLKELENSLPQYACVSAEGMHDNGDSVHFNAASLRELGIRYARKFEEIRDRDNRAD